MMMWSYDDMMNNWFSKEVINISCWQVNWDGPQQIIEDSVQKWSALTEIFAQVKGLQLEKWKFIDIVMLPQGQVWSWKGKKT